MRCCLPRRFRPTTTRPRALFDTQSTAAVPLSPATSKPDSGWLAVPEDNLTHRFRGDLAARNDRLLLVLRSKGAGAEVYAQTAAGPKLRAVLAPLGAADKEPPLIAGWQIVENNPGAVMVTAAFEGGCRLGYRLTAGQMIVELRPGDGTDRIRLQAESRYVVVPDFFGDDLVFSAKTFVPGRSRLRLPTENFFLNLAADGRSEIMCVWPSRRQEAVALAGAAGFSACEIQAVKDKNLWVAVLEGDPLWHTQDVAAVAEVESPWQAPFPAEVAGRSARRARRGPLLVSPRR